MPRTISSLVGLIVAAASLTACGDAPEATAPPSTPPVLTTAPPNLTTTTTEQVQQRKVYAVQPGDTLGVIANGFNVTVDAIMAENGLEDTVLTIGQTLIIPPPTTAPSTSTAG
jgi:LysM repeat protein